MLRCYPLLLETSGIFSTLFPLAHRRTWPPCVCHSQSLGCRGIRSLSCNTTDVACLNLVLKNQFSAQQFPLQSAGSSTPESTLFDPPIDDNKTVMSTMGRWEFLIKANEITDGRPDMKVRVKDEYFTNQVLLYLKSQRPLMLLRMHSNNVNHHFQVLDL